MVSKVSSLNTTRENSTLSTSGHTVLLQGAGVNGWFAVDFCRGSLWVANMAFIIMPLAEKSLDIHRPRAAGKLNTSHRSNSSCVALLRHLAHAGVGDLDAAHPPALWLTATAGWGASPGRAGGPSSTAGGLSPGRGGDCWAWRFQLVPHPLAQNVQPGGELFQGRLGGVTPAALHLAKAAHSNNPAKWHESLSS